MRSLSGLYLALVACVEWWIWTVTKSVGVCGYALMIFVILALFLLLTSASHQRRKDEEDEYRRWRHEHGLDKTPLRESNNH